MDLHTNNDKPTLKHRRDKPTLKHRRADLYSIVLILFPFLVIALLEGSLRLFDYKNLDLFVPSASFQGQLVTNPAVSLRYFSRDDQPTLYRHQILKQKPKNGYRIFMVGESTSIGWPYDANMMPSRILESRLASAFPDRNIEAVNVGMTASNTYTVLDLLDEILKQSPDAILIYSGQNEYYGALGVGSSRSVGRQRWLVKTYLELQHFKSFLLLKDAIEGLQGLFVFESGSGGSGRGTRMLRMVGETSIPYASPLYQQGVAQYEANLREIVSRATAAGVKVIISELVSNLRDQPPFASASGQGQEGALSAYQQAQKLEQVGNFSAARAAYVRAKDLDIVRFRAPEEFNQIIHRVADDYNVPVVPMVAAFEKNSPNGIIGASLMIDHLHPNEKGYFLMSEAFLETLCEHDMISNAWPDKSRSQEYQAQWGITELDRKLAEMRVNILKDFWPFKPLTLSGRAHSSEKRGSKKRRSPLESLAVKVLKGKKSVIDAHGQLAKEQEGKGQISEALREYQAMISINPYVTLNVARHATLLALKNDQKETALSILRSVLRAKPIPEAATLMGQIYLRDNRSQDAIHYLEQAREWGPKADPKLLSLLAKAYAMSGRHE